LARAAAFDWNDANTSHIARQGVALEEVEQALANDPLVVWPSKSAVARRGCCARG